VSDFSIGFVIFPGPTQLEFTAPLKFSRLGTFASLPSQQISRSEVHGKPMLPIVSDRGFGILPDETAVSVALDVTEAYL
jgi:cyclohexyl-isocyanide hydratase